ncbi:ribonuclease H-like domain-containing protein [Phyllosticta capitalensis]
MMLVVPTTFDRQKLNRPGLDGRLPLSSQLRRSLPGHYHEIRPAASSRPWNTVAKRACLSSPCHTRLWSHRDRQKVCAHIHGALPYLYLDYDGSLEPDEFDAYVNSLRISIDHALAVSYRRNAYDGKALFVAHISLVKGVPFFGYHVGYKYYLKVYLLNPLHMTRLAELLQQGNILAKVMQPHESHLQYLAQWMCDYNLFGCGYIDCAKVRFRAPVPEWESLSQTTHRWHDRSIPSIHILPDDEFLARVTVQSRSMSVYRTS